MIFLLRGMDTVVRQAACLSARCHEFQKVAGSITTHSTSGVANTFGKSAVGGSAEAFEFRETEVRLGGRPDC